MGRCGSWSLRSMDSCGQHRGVRRQHRAEWNWTSLVRPAIQSLVVQHSETESHTGDDGAVVAVKEATTNTAAATAPAADFDEEALLDETRVYSCAMQHFLVLNSTTHLRIR